MPVASNVNVVPVTDSTRFLPFNPDGDAPAISTTDHCKNAWPPEIVAVATLLDTVSDVSVTDVSPFTRHADNRAIPAPTCPLSEGAPCIPLEYQTVWQATHQSSETVVPVPSCGVMPVEIAMFGVTIPEYRIFPVPLDAVPIEKCVAVSEPPVACGNEIMEVGTT